MAAPPECVILVGLPGAGKSTFYRAHLAATHQHISKDLWPHARDRQARQDAALRAALTAGRSVAIDNTNVTRASRAAIVRIANTCGARVRVYYLEVPVRVAVARNQRREGRARVPKVAIFTAAKSLEPPALDEGFDALEIVVSEPDSAG